MNYNILNDFELNSAVAEEIMKKYESLIPNELIEIWKEYGFGSFANGYFKVINQDDYKEVLESTAFPDAIYPIMTTGLADIIIWDSEDNDLGLVKFRKGQLDRLEMNFSEFMNLLSKDKSHWQKQLDAIQYDEDVEKYGKIAYEECFGYFPLLILGGSEKVESLKKCNLMVHIDIMSQC